jgi:hypothetical protein
MAAQKSLRLQVELRLTDQAEPAAPLAAYAFAPDGRLLAAVPIAKGVAALELPPDLAGRRATVVVAPQLDKGMPVPSKEVMLRAGGYAKPVRLLPERASLRFEVPSLVFPKWCFCLVRGRLVKRFTLPDGSTAERPVCHARVHVCEVDRIPLVIEKLPEPDLFRLRDDLLDKLRVIPIPRPIPEPDPGPFRLDVDAVALNPQPLPPGPPDVALRRMVAAPLALAGSPAQQLQITSLATAHSAADLRRRLAGLAHLIVIHLCEWRWLWSWFRVDEIAVIDADGQGRFARLIVHDCKDQPDLYFWVEQFDGATWKTVYRPSVGCGTRWNYVCGTEVVLNLPNATACDEPDYDIPPGVTLFVLPWSIGHTPVWGALPAAPTGWLRSDGLVNYHAGGGLGLLTDAPFGGTLNFVHDDSWFIPSAGIRYYRYSWRRHSSAVNTGPADTSWTPMLTPLSRAYRMEYNSGGMLPTYQGWLAGPHTVGAQQGLFAFKPQVPPTLPTDPPNVAVREWITGNVNDTAASWDTVAAAPPLSDTQVVDQAGAYHVKIEVFDAAGNQVLPGAATFRFLCRNADGTTTRLATAGEEQAGAYVLRVHVDNNGVASALPQPSIGGVAASDNCGFLRYNPGDLVRIAFHASHPNDRAVFGFGVVRGSNGLAAASTLAPWVEVAAASAPTATTSYTLVAGNYQHDFTPAELVGSCVNAAFAASLGVWGKATNGTQRIGYDASRLIAFALAKPGGPA